MKIDCFSKWSPWQLFCETLLSLNHILILLSKYLCTFGWITSNRSYVKALPKTYTHADRDFTIFKLDRIRTKRWFTVYLSVCQCKGLRKMGGIGITKTFSHVLPMLWYLNVYILMQSYLILVHANMTCACTCYNIMMSLEKKTKITLKLDKQRLIWYY